MTDGTTRWVKKVVWLLLSYVQSVAGSESSESTSSGSAGSVDVARMADSCASATATPRRSRLDDLGCSTAQSRL